MHSLEKWTKHCANCGGIQSNDKYRLFTRYLKYEKVTIGNAINKLFFKNSKKVVGQTWIILKGDKTKVIPKLCEPCFNKISVLHEAYTKFLAIQPEDSYVRKIIAYRNELMALEDSPPNPVVSVPGTQYLLYSSFILANLKSLFFFAHHLHMHIIAWVKPGLDSDRQFLPLFLVLLNF